MAKKIGREIDISDADKDLLDGYASRQGITTSELVDQQISGLVTTAKSAVVAQWWRNLSLADQYRIYEANQ